LSPASGLTTVWSTDFDQLKVTHGAPDGAHDWYAQNDIRPNGETEIYDIRQCAAYPDSAGLVTDGTNYNFCIVSDANATGLSPGSSATNALQLRTYWNAAQNQWNSGRINSKRMHEFKPSSTTGIQIEARLKNPPRYNSDGSKTGMWPAFWMLGRRLSESPFIGDGDTVCWPNDGAHEIDIMEWGAQWPGNYNKSTLHYRTGAVICQNEQGAPGVDNGDGNDNGLLANGYHKYTLEWETTAMRFFMDGVQEGGDVNVTGMNYEGDASFMILNAALGGALGGAGTPQGNNGSLYVDYIKVSSYNPANRGGASPAQPRDISANLEAENNDGYSNPVHTGSSDPQGLEACAATSGVCSVKDMGWSDNGDYVQWLINVPQTANYTLTTNNAAAAASTFQIYTGDSSFNNMVLKAGPSIGNGGNIASTGGYQAWAQNTTGAFTLNAGVQSLRFQFTSGNQNLDWAKLAIASTCSNGVQDTASGETGIDCGGPCVACSTIALGSHVEAENYTLMSGVQLENGNTDVGYFDAGDYVKYPSVNMGTVGGMRMNIASGNTGGIFKVKIDGPSGQTLGSYTVSSTGGWPSWVTVTMDFTTTTTGTHDLYIVGDTGTGIANLNWFELATASGTHVGPGATCADGALNQGEQCIDQGGPCACGSCNVGTCAVTSSCQGPANCAFTSNANSWTFLKNDAAITSASGTWSNTNGGEYKISRSSNSYSGAIQALQNNLTGLSAGGSKTISFNARVASGTKTVWYYIYYGGNTGARSGYCSASLTTTMSPFSCTYSVNAGQAAYGIGMDFGAETNTADIFVDNVDIR